MVKKYLDEVYNLKHKKETINLYQLWSKTYDKELNDNGYVTPQRCASALASTNTDKNEKILDIGCGTGLSGEAFKNIGFTDVEGTDFSSKMLQIAKSKNIYSKLFLTQNENPLNLKTKTYKNTAAVGVFSPLHAGPEMIPKMLKIASVEGFFVFSLNDHALENPKYQKEVSRLEKLGYAKIIFEEYGEHLPKIDLKAMVYVLKRLK